MTVRVWAPLPGPFFLTFGFGGLIRGLRGVIQWVFVAPLILILWLLLWVISVVAWCLLSAVREIDRARQEEIERRHHELRWKVYYEQVMEWNERYPAWAIDPQTGKYVHEVKHPTNFTPSPNLNTWSDRR